MKTKKNKLEQTTLTEQEWNEALKMPTPVRNKTKYKRKPKHKSDNYDEWYPDSTF